MLHLTQIKQLPLVHQTTITSDYLDAMGHMNIRHYMGIFDDAAWIFFARFGMDQAYYDRSSGGAFALEHHVRYLAEVHAGDTVTVRTRILGRTAKRIHFMHFMIDETAVKLAATLEVIGSHADLHARRTSPFPPDLAANIDAILAQHSQLTWAAPVCGVMAP